MLYWLKNKKLYLWWCERFYWLSEDGVFMDITKNKDVWINDYYKKIKELSNQEKKMLETSWPNDKKEVYFRTNDKNERINLWLIDTLNCWDLTIEMQVGIDLVSDGNIDGCKIIIKPKKFKIYYPKIIFFFYSIFIVIFSIISGTIVPFVFVLFQIFVLYIQKKVFYKKTLKRVIRKIQEI